MILNNSVEAFILYHSNSLQSVQQQWYYCVREIRKHLYWLALRKQGRLLNGSPDFAHWFAPQGGSSSGWRNWQTGAVDG